MTSRNRYSTQGIDARPQLDALAARAFCDKLTGLPDRHLVKERQQRPRRVKRGGRVFALLYIDIDRLKRVNDASGREAGDELLCQVAARLTRSLRASDRVVRWDGDEFVVLVNGLNEPPLVTRVARKLLAACGSPFALSAGTHCITVSIGISCYPSDADDIATLVRCAEQAMYSVKRRSRHRALAAPDRSAARVSGDSL